MERAILYIFGMQQQQSVCGPANLRAHSHAYSTHPVSGSLLCILDQFSEQKDTAQQCLMLF